MRNFMIALTVGATAFKDLHSASVHWTEWAGTSVRSKNVKS
jgi:hypothetical protein